MQIRTSKLVWSAAALLAVGTATGLSAPALLQVKDAPVTGPAGAASHVIPLIATPNYRAIVAQNQASVVGIMTAGEMQTREL